MKTLFAAAIALSLVTGTAATAQADSRQDARHESHSHDRKDDHHGDRRNDHGNDRSGHRDGRYDDHRGHPDFRRWDPRDYRAGYAQGRHDQRRYDRGRYIPPRGFYQHRWRYGERLPKTFYVSRYIVHDYHRYALRAPPRGYHWVRVQNDVLLAAITSGVVVAVVNNLFD